MVFTVNGAEVLPAATVTVAETVANASELLNLTTIPPAPAGPLRVIVPVGCVPPATAVGVRVTDCSEGGLIDSPAVIEVFPFFPVIVTNLYAETGEVLIVKVTSLCPDGTVTVAGTVAAELLLDRLTTNPFVPALAFKLTVPVVATPPFTVDGLTLTRASVMGEIVRVAV